MTTPGAPVAAHGDQQRGGPPPEWLMSQRPGHGVADDPLFAAAPAPTIVLGHPARQHGSVGPQALSDHLKAERVETAESGHISAGEARTTGSVGHVEVFRMGSVRTPIIGRPRPLPRQRRADDPYTLECEEPHSDAESDDDPQSDIPTSHGRDRVLAARQVWLRCSALAAEAAIAVARAQPRQICNHQNARNHPDDGSMGRKASAWPRSTMGSSKSSE